MELIPEFKVRLKSYLEDISRAHTEAVRAYLFLEFVRSVFRDVDAGSPQSLYPDLEKRIKSSKTLIVRGRIDALLGNVIVEFETSLSPAKLGESKEQLSRYVAILWNEKGRIEYVCMASDGTSFKVFRPFSSKQSDFQPDDVGLEVIDTLEIPQASPEHVLKWLDRYLLSSKLVLPTADEIDDEFGSDSPVFNLIYPLLTRAWSKAKSFNVAAYTEWSHYLSIVYGASIDSEDLFLRHTYLATLAKLMVYLYYSGNALPSEVELEKVLTGEAFRNWGIENFLEEDFFSWIARGPIQHDGIGLGMRLLDSLARYDFSRMTEDVLKGLYQKLVDPEKRHDLGEFYTPEWLAEMIVSRILASPELSVIDPACGSGTFLAASIRAKRKSLEKKTNPSDLLSTIVTSVVGVDVHPLAVLVAKTLYLMSLGPLLKAKQGTVRIPVYMADSIVFPSVTQDLIRGIPVYNYPVSNQSHLTIPKEIVDKGINDAIVDFLRDTSNRMASGITVSRTEFEHTVRARIPHDMQLSSHALEILNETASQLADLIRNHKDTIYGYIIKNVYKPALLGGFDLVTGNPPWLAYRDVKSKKYQAQLKDLIIGRYGLVEASEAKLMTHLELATLFFARAVDLYLKDYGTIAFVMPRGVFNGDQHDRFRRNLVRVRFGFKKIFDLEKSQRERVTPLFSVESCVVFADKNQDTRYPVPAVAFQGHLPRKNTTLAEVENLRKMGKFWEQELKVYVVNVGRRSAWSYAKDLELKGVGSPYRDKFRQGATIFPRPFWMVSLVKHELFGIDPLQPLVESSKRAQALAKSQWQDLSFSGRVESRFLYGTLLGSDILPFAHKKPKLVVLPIEKNSHYRILESREAKRRGYENLASWLEKAEKAWSEGRGEKGGKKNATIYEWLDWGNKLTHQDPRAKHLVLYNTSGRNHLAACIVDMSDSLSVKSNGSELRLNGLVVESACYYFSTDNMNEAYYLTAMLNSRSVFRYLSVIKAFRHIHKKVWELPIPIFDSTDSVHRELARLGEEASRKAAELAPEFEQKEDESLDLAIGHQRGKMETYLAEILDKIDRAVNELLRVSMPISSMN